MLNSIVACALAAAALAQPLTTVEITPPSREAWATIAEQSAFEATSTHAQVVALMDLVAKDAPRVARRVSMGTSVEGKELPVLVLSDPPVATAGEARALADKEGRVIVLLFGNIHAGEVDAKEAYLILARQLIEAHEGKKSGGEGVGTGKTPVPQESEADTDLLKKLIILIAPIYNADGNDRFGPNEANRPHQDGPGRMGIRHNAMDLDLNRDFGKLESPEARGLVALLNEWDPHVVVDGHTTDGSYHRNLLTYASSKAPAGDARLNALARRMLPSVGESLRRRTDIDSFWYGDFEGEHAQPPRGHTRWETPPALPRYSTHYIGLRGRIGILSESYSYSPYKGRVVASLEFAREILRHCARHAEQIRTTTENASRAGAGKDGLLREIAIRTRPIALPGSVTVKGYVEATAGGKAVSTNVPKDYECALIDGVEATLTVTRPRAYVFTTPVPAVVENLRRHGVNVQTLEKETAFDAEVYAIDSATNAASRWQGHVLVVAEATPKATRITVPAGTAIVWTDQPLGNLACYWLEPECEDGLTTWNFFDAWCTPGAVFPVARVVGVE